MMVRRCMNSIKRTFRTRGKYLTFPLIFLLHLYVYNEIKTMYRTTNQRILQIANESYNNHHIAVSTEEKTVEDPILELMKLGSLKYRTVSQQEVVSIKTNFPLTQNRRKLASVNQPHLTYGKKLVHRQRGECNIISHHLFPMCEEKIAYLFGYWKYSTCFEKTHKINGSKCSILRYFQTVEQYCAGPIHIYQQKQYITADFNYNINDMLEILSDEKFYWMRRRVTFLWSTWMKGVMNFKNERKRFNRKKVVVYLGTFAVRPYFLDKAGNGGPLGEIIQWTDLIAALYILDYDVIVSKNLHDLSRIMEIKRSGCAPPYARNKGDIDLIYTDIQGVSSLTEHYGASTVANFRCKFRVLDSFGTDPAYNYNLYPYKLPRGRSVWGNLNLKTTQFLTMFPHTQDNYFLGFIMPTVSTRSIRKSNQTRQKALIYAKLSSYIRGYEKYLEVISQFFDVYATCVIDDEKPLPSFIHNYGPVSYQRIQELLSQSKLFIGVGFPYEGPGPLEAMANGAVFLQPKFKEPVSKLNNDFFKTKPTLRKLESQSPYMQEFIGLPYCFTIDVFNEILLRKTLHQIHKMRRLPAKIPFEFSSTGFLKRVYVFTEYIDYCNPYQPRWPPENKLQIFSSIAGQSCKETCMQKSLVCEPTYFDLLNNVETIERHTNISCALARSKMHLHAPSIDAGTQECYLQAHGHLFSCMSSLERVVRVCPCRDCEREQTAICRNCL